jgi:Protein of unknown function (DUF1569)
MSGTPSRRELNFATFDEVLADIDSLRARGYDRLGNWDLAQICGHLADWLRFPVHGFPRSGPLMLMVWFLLRNMVGKMIRRRILTRGQMPTGKPTLKVTVSAAGADEEAGVEKLRLAIRDFTGHAGEYIPSPFFGVMNREEWARFERIHCALHLGFLIPKVN